MTRLLIVTDNTFYRSGQEVFDDSSSMRLLRDDAAVFDEVGFRAGRPDHTRLWPSLGGRRPASSSSTSTTCATLHGSWRPGGAIPAPSRCRRLGGRGAHAPALSRRLARGAPRPPLGQAADVRADGDPLAVGLNSASHRGGGDPVLAHPADRPLEQCWLLRQPRPSAAALSGRGRHNHRLNLEHTPAGIRLSPPARRAGIPDRLRLVLVAEFMACKTTRRCWTPWLSRRNSGPDCR